MIRVTKDRGFVLDTKDTTYVIGVSETGQLLHIYYGKRIVVDETVEDFVVEGIFDKMLEMNAVSKDDNREALIELDLGDNNQAEFVYSSYTIDSSEISHQGLPGVYSVSNNLHLCITAKDKVSGAEVDLHYLVFEKENVIVRSATLRNPTDTPIKASRLLSMQMDIPGNDRCAKQLDNNSIFYVCDDETSNDADEVYAFDLIYSRNQYNSVEPSEYNLTRICAGINPNGFTYTLMSGERVDTPETVMTFSEHGFCAAGNNISAFEQRHIARCEYQNNKKANVRYVCENENFAWTEKNLIQLAKESAKQDIDILLLDDKIFCHGENSDFSIGDWVIDAKKLPSGLEKLAEKINKNGLELGLWIRPEIVYSDSVFYGEHPEWTLGKGCQLTLDLCNPFVVSYLIAAVSDVIKQGNIKYIRWECVNDFSDMHSLYLENDRQGELIHRYLLGFYQITGALEERFPEVLFEYDSAFSSSGTI